LPASLLGFQAYHTSYAQEYSWTQFQKHLWETKLGYLTISAKLSPDGLWMTNYILYNILNPGKQTKP
jgi:hypothetical protein